MTIGFLFESLAGSTWQRLADAHRLGVSQGETALTDHLLLEIARANHPHVRVVKTPISEEDVKGTDWEWWIGTTHAGWLRYAAQAKRMNVASGRYDQLRHMVGTTRQVDILRSYALANRAIPLYCLYNYSAGASSAHWHCQRAFDVSQLGCSVAPLRIIEGALKTRGGRTFDTIHLDDFVVPWRCLVRCPRFIGAFVRGQPRIREAATQDLTKVFGVEPTIYQALPPGLQRAMEESFSGNDDRQAIDADGAFDRDFYNANVGMYPRRIAVVDLSSSDDLSSVRLRPNEELNPTGAPA